MFVGNDVAENFLWQNDGTGKFQDVALEAGVAYDMDGVPQGSMALDAADYNHDGRLDFYQTSYAMQISALFEGLGDGFFEDAARRTRAGADQLGVVTWGCSFGDFDNDTWPDLFVAAGHLQDNIERINSMYRYKQRNLLYRNLGGRAFANVTAGSGAALAQRQSSRGSAIGDLDNDGDLDIVILHSRAAPTVLRNDSENDHHWVQITCRGTQGNRDGIGARVQVTAGGETQTAEVHSGRSYQSHYGTRLHFGLGPHAKIERIEVRWLGGGRDVLTDVEADQHLVVTEGASR